MAFEAGSDGLSHEVLRAQTVIFRYGDAHPPMASLRKQKDQWGEVYRIKDALRLPGAEATGRRPKMTAYRLSRASGGDDGPTRSKSFCTAAKMARAPGSPCSARPTIHISAASLVASLSGADSCPAASSSSLRALTNSNKLPATCCLAKFRD
jgi:hypothetical protein